jgi:uncharacterized membrane protein YebE (DUF533 family)
MLTGSRRRSGGSLRNMAGIAGLGYLAYKAYDKYQQSQSGRPQGAGSSQGGGGPSLGDRLAGLLGGGDEQSQAQAQAAEAAIDDQHALLLIRAMIAAAYADGEITPDERGRILGRLDEAGADAEERRVVEQEIANPKSMDAIVRDVKDQETAEQVYLASLLAIEPDSQAERSYLDYLAARLNLSADEVKELRSLA